MKRIIFIFTFVALAGASMLISGCPRPIGQCTYSESGVKAGTVEIVSITQEPQTGGQPLYLIETKGLFSRSFAFSEADYKACIGGPGYTQGSEAPGAVMPGGPCPPQYRIGTCPWQ